MITIWGHICPSVTVIVRLGFIHPVLTFYINILHIGAGRDHMFGLRFLRGNLLQVLSAMMFFSSPFLDPIQHRAEHFVTFTSHEIVHGTARKKKTINHDV